LLLPKESTFLRRKPESGCFGHRHSHQHYQGVLNTVCTLCRLYTKAVFGDKYLHYLYFLSAGLCRVAKCKKVKELKWLKKLKNWDKLKPKNLHFLWWIISKSFNLHIFWSNILQPWLFGRSKIMETLWWSLGRFDVSAFSDDHHHSAFSTIAKGLIKEIKEAHQGKNSCW